MKLSAILLFLAGISHSAITSGGLAPSITGTSPSFSGVTITGTSSGCLVAGTTALYVDCSNFRVGVGTTTPSATFEVVGNKAAGTSVGDFLVDTANKTVFVGRQSSTGGDHSIFTVRNRSGNSAFTVDPANNIAYFNDPNGSSVGIGTSLPATKFHISSGTVTLDGNSAAITSSGAYTGTGVNGNVISASSITTTGGLFGTTLAVGGSSITSAGAMILTPSQALNVSGANGNIIGTSSITTTGAIYGTVAIFGAGATHSTFTATGSLAVLATQGAPNTPSATFSPSLSSGTVSAALSGTFTNTALGPCIASSTGSMVLPISGEIRFDVHCTISVASLAAVLGAGVIVDGGFVDGETISKGATAPQEAVSTDGTNMSFTIYASGLTAASHSYCFSPFVSTNTGTIDSTNSICHLHAHMMP